LSHVCSRALTRIAASSSPIRQLTITTTASTQGRHLGTQPLDGATSSVQLLPGTCTSVTIGLTGSCSLCVMQELESRQEQVLKQCKTSEVSSQVSDMHMPATTGVPCMQLDQAVAHCAKHSRQ
jgi:hypothetical protein